MLYLAQGETMKKIAIVGFMLCSLIGFAQKDESVSTTIGNENLLFYFVPAKDVSPAWYQIFVQVNGSETMLASQHSLVDRDTPTCNSLYYLRAWLTAADNGVNGKRSTNHEPLNGAAGEAMAVRDQAIEFSDALHCNDPKAKKTFSCTRTIRGEKTTIDACTDLNSLANLGAALNRETTGQSNSGRSGRRYYGGN